MEVTAFCLSFLMCTQLPTYLHGSTEVVKLPSIKWYLFKILKVPEFVSDDNVVAFINLILTSSSFCIFVAVANSHAKTSSAFQGVLFHSVVDFLNYFCQNSSNDFEQYGFHIEVKFGWRRLILSIRITVLFFEDQSCSVEGVWLMMIMTTDKI